MNWLSNVMNHKKLILYAILNLLLLFILFFESVLKVINQFWRFSSFIIFFLLLLFITYHLVRFMKECPVSYASLTSILVEASFHISFIILIYANIYQQIHFIKGKKAFTGKSLESNDFLYYSVTTFTTTGYGDISSIGAFSNAVAASEMLFGSVVNTILMAILTSILLRRIRD